MHLTLIVSTEGTHEVVVAFMNIAVLLIQQGYYFDNHVTVDFSSDEYLKLAAKSNSAVM